MVSFMTRDKRIEGSVDPYIRVKAVSMGLEAALAHPRTKIREEPLLGLTFFSCLFVESVDSANVLCV